MRTGYSLCAMRLDSSTTTAPQPAPPPPAAPPAKGRWGARRPANQRGAPRHAGRHPEEENLHQPILARREPRVQISEVLLGAADRTEDKPDVHRGLLLHPH